MRRLVATFCLGVVLGCAAMLSWSARQIDAFFLSNKQLLLEQSETKSRLKVLESRLEQYHTLIVVGVDYQYDSLPDNLQRLELQSQLKTIVGSFFGQAVREINPDTLVALLDERLVAVGEKTYRIGVRAVVLSERLKYYLTITEHHPTQNEGQ